MRDRVETGKGMLFAFGLPGVVVWWWHGHTSAPSMWWVISLVGMIAAAIGVVRGAQLILSGFSGFGRNFYEERDPVEQSVGDAAGNESGSRDSEAAHVVALPSVLAISGGLVVMFKVLPAMNFVPEFEGEHWVSPRVLVPWMFIAGIVLVAWSVLLLLMLKTGPDRWENAPDTRPEIRQWTRIYIVVGIILMLTATAYSTSG